jgi:hypothetical protein
MTEQHHDPSLPTRNQLDFLKVLEKGCKKLSACLNSDAPTPAARAMRARLDLAKPQPTEKPGKGEKPV